MPPSSSPLTPELAEVMLRGAGDPVFLLDLDGWLLACNPAAERTFGAATAPGKPTHASVIHPDSGAAMEALALRIREGQQGRIEYEGWRIAGDGQRRWMAMVAAPVLEPDGTTRAIVVTMRDQTELHLARLQLDQNTRRLEQSNRDLEAFASVASHDLREPLRKIFTFARRLRSLVEDRLPAPAIGFLDRIEASVDRMERLIESLLAYARIAQPEHAMTRVQLSQVVRNVQDDLDTMIERTGAQIQVGPLPTITANQTLVHQLFENLIANALKFVRADVAPVVTVSCVATAANQCQIEVTDNGIGFENKHADRIFHLLHRLHGRHEFDGSGMGLSICKRITELHGGTLVARGAPGVGATFTVTLTIDHSAERLDHRE